MLTFINEKQNRLIKAVMERGGIPYNRLYSMLKKKDIKVNGRRVNENITVRPGDEITVYDAAKFIPKIIYEDDNILTVYKPKRISAEEYAIQMTNHTVILCHRLDTNTDGLLLFAKTSKAYDSI